jgi:hypothetical protein
MTQPLTSSWTFLLRRCELNCYMLNKCWKLVGIVDESCVFLRPMSGGVVQRKIHSIF